MRNIAILSLLGLALGLAACNPSQTSSSYDVGEASPTEVADQTQKEENAKVLQNPYYIEGNKYFNEGHVHAPAGANAIESFLKARKSFSSPQPGIEEAIEDMEPYLVIAIEKAIAEQNEQEATRLVGLLKTMNNKAPSLPRLEQEIAQLSRLQ